MFSVPTENQILKDKFTIKMKIQSSSPHPSVLVESHFWSITAKQRRSILLNSWSRWGRASTSDRMLAKAFSLEANSWNFGLKKKGVTNVFLHQFGNIVYLVWTEGMFNQNYFKKDQIRDLWWRDNNGRRAAIGSLFEKLATNSSPLVADRGNQHPNSNICTPKSGFNTDCICDI